MPRLARLDIVGVLQHVIVRGIEHHDIFSDDHDRQRFLDRFASLLTGYALAFNRRYKRSGHLFQNRYRSIVCEEESYLLELVRYIHLNPLRAGMVKSLDELDHYPWSGHAVLLGTRNLDCQETK
ncbi:MAG: hypothetical protein RBQ99_06230 [Trichlorobacter sp.]|nr:hypothetical protein [Trichlorobacter sp.]